MESFFLYAMSILYIIAGINHFINPKFYHKIMPPWVPWHKIMVSVSGILELLLGLLLLVAETKVFAAWGIIILLILIFPANIQMTLNFYRKKHPLFWIAILRLPLQFLLIWWAWLYV